MKLQEGNTCYAADYHNCSNGRFGTKVLGTQNATMKNISEFKSEN
jgi:hypothetical protein